MICEIHTFNLKTIFSFQNSSLYFFLSEIIQGPLDMFNHTQCGPVPLVGKHCCKEQAEGSV